MRKAKVLSVRLDEAEFLALKAEADLQGTTMGAVARRAIAAQVEEFAASVDAEQYLQDDHRRRDEALAALRALLATG